MRELARHQGLRGMLDTASIDVVPPVSPSCAASTSSFGDGAPTPTSPRRQTKRHSPWPDSRRRPLRQRHRIPHRTPTPSTAVVAPRTARPTPTLGRGCQQHVKLTPIGSRILTPCGGSTTGRMERETRLDASQETGTSGLRFVGGAGAHVDKWTLSTPRTWRAYPRVVSVRWTAADVPDLGGRTVVVTWTNSGIGVVTARELARVDAHVVAAGVRRGWRWFHHRHTPAEILDSHQPPPSIMTTSHSDHDLSPGREDVGS